MTGAPSSPSSPTMPCRQPTTRPSAPCAWPSSPGASASEREPRKGAPPTPPPCPSLKPAEGAASIPGHTSLTLSPAPERTCITSRFLSQFERKGGERLRRRRLCVEAADHHRLVGYGSGGRPVIDGPKAPPSGSTSSMSPKGPTGQKTVVEAFFCHRQAGGALLSTPRRRGLVQNTG